MFIWININHNSDKILFKDITYFSAGQNQFTTVPIATIFADISMENSYFEHSIKSKLVELGYNKGIEINILSENERWTWTEFCGIIPVLLATALHVLTNRATINQLNDETTFSNSPNFEHIYQTAIKLFPKSNIDSHGIITYTAMGNARAPMIAHTQTKQKHETKTDILDFLNISDTTNQPMIDYGILSFGSSYDEYYTNHLPKTQNSQNEIGAHLNEKLLNARWNILKCPYDEKAIEDFIGVIIEQGIFGTFVESDHTLFTDTIFLFSQIKQFQDEKIWLMPLTSNKCGGSFLFATKYKKSRETMEKLLMKLGEIGHNTANYQYLSWMDWFTNAGLKVEQYISQNFFSSYVKNDCAMLQDLWWQTFIGSYNDLLIRQAEGIIFDTINKKIYINGENVTHKDLFTQSATVEIVEVLFNNKWHYIKNNALPPSSYSKNKNDMTGKIILPLQQLMEKKFKEKLELTCSWSIVNFDLMLNTWKIPIRLIKKIV